jgi:hypothetical protein
MASTARAPLQGTAGQGTSLVQAYSQARRLNTAAAAAAAFAPPVAHLARPLVAVPTPHVLPRLAALRTIWMPWSWEVEALGE